jgi:hypothetical protein
MQEPNPERVANPWRRRFYLVLIAWLVSTFLLSITAVRGVVAYPLYVHDEQAAGEVAYVMADGEAYWERLRAASDLFHWKRVTRIAILDEERSAGYNFIQRKSNTRYERAVDYLALFGVPNDRVSGIQENESAWMGSLSEAQGFAVEHPNIKKVVVVTSAPHTRRSKLCFQRSLASNVDVQIYAASAPQQSSEIRSPLWIEYVKLVVYWVAA